MSMNNALNGRRQAIAIYKLVYGMDYVAPSMVYIDDETYFEIYEIMMDLSDVDRQILYRRTGKYRQQSYEEIGSLFGMTAEEVEKSEILLILSLKPILPPIINSKTHARRVEQIKMLIDKDGINPALRIELLDEAISPYASSRTAKKYYAEIATLDDMELDYYTKKALKERGANTLSDILYLSGKKIPGVSGAYAKRLVETIHALGHGDFSLAV